MRFCIISQKTPSTRKDNYMKGQLYETDIMECKRASRLCRKRLS